MRLAAFFQFKLSMLCNNQWAGQEVGRYWQMGRQKKEKKEEEMGENERIRALKANQCSHNNTRLICWPVSKRNDKKWITIKHHSSIWELWLTWNIIHISHPPVLRVFYNVAVHQCQSIKSRSHQRREKKPCHYCYLPSTSSSLTYVNAPSTCDPHIHDIIINPARHNVGLSLPWSMARVALCLNEAVTLT